MWSIRPPASSRMEEWRPAGIFFEARRGNCRAGSQGFDATQFAAFTAWPAIVDSDVTALGCGSCAAVIDAAVEYNAGADAGADRCAENVAITAPGAPDGFSQSRGVAVVIDTNRQMIRFRYQFSQGEI